MGRGKRGGGQKRVNIAVERKVKNRYKTCGSGGGGGGGGHGWAWEHIGSKKIKCVI